MLNINNIYKEARGFCGIFICFKRIGLPKVLASVTAFGEQALAHRPGASAVFQVVPLIGVRRISNTFALPRPSGEARRSVSNMRVKDLAKIVESWTSSDPEGSFKYDEVLRNLTAHDDINCAINIDTEKNGSWLKRTRILDKDIEIKGNFIIVDHTPHNGDLIIRNFKSKEEVENFLLGNQGPFNPFCGFAIPIFNPIPLFYRLYFIQNGQNCEFSKTVQYEDSKAFERKYIKRTIKWTK